MTYRFPMLHDVIIAGAGPVGLFLACELRLAKLTVLVLEKSASPETPSKRLPFGMRGLWGPSIEAFHRRGLLVQVAAPHGTQDNPRQPRPGPLTSGPRRGPAGHFAGIQSRSPSARCTSPRPKLAATLRNEAPTGLLDTYTAERHPVGALVLDWTRAQVALMRPSSRALQAVMRDLIATRDGATYFAERVWGVSLHYDLGEPHPLVGRSSPDFELGDGTRLGELLRDGRGVLLDFGGRASLQTLASLWSERVGYVSADATDCLGLCALLVRPDGFVAWASDSPPVHDDIKRAAARWFV